MRYSDRKKLAETGALGDLMHDSVPGPMRTAVNAVVGAARAEVGKLFTDDLNRELIAHFGVGQPWTSYTSSLDVDGFLDFVEILIETGGRQYHSATMHRGQGGYVIALPDAEERLNRVFERFRFGYRIEGGEVRQIGSPSLELAIAGPALLAVQREGWNEVERSYREALVHQRSSETDDALTAANAAVEAALKASGMEGRTLKELAQSFKRSGLVPGYLEKVPELLEDLLDRLHAARSQEGDAHGKAPDAPDVPPELATLAIYWAGAFIVYLADATQPAQQRPA